jgi:hypothetical protein
MRKREVLNKIASEKGTPRRGFLSGVGGLVTASAAGVASASEPSQEALQEVAREWHSESSIREALEGQWEAVLAGDAGEVINDLSDLPIGQLYESIEEYADANTGAMVFGVDGPNGPTPKIEIKKQFSDSHRLYVSIKPKQGAASSRLIGTGNEVPESTSVTENGHSTTTSSDPCFESRKYCEVYCGPYSCTCMETYQCLHKDDCYTGDSCTGCSSNASC